MKIYTKPPKRKYKVTYCTRCRRVVLCTWHHLYRKRNKEDWIWLCCEGQGNCHDFVHANPAKAIKEGFYRSFDGEYRKKVKKFKMPKLS